MLDFEKTLAEYKLSKGLLTLLNLQYVLWVLPFSPLNPTNQYYIHITNFVSKPFLFALNLFVCNSFIGNVRNNQFFYACNCN